MKRKTSTKPTRIWKFAAKLTPESVAVAHEILWRKQRYYNALVRIERDRHERYAKIRGEHMPELGALEAEWERLDDAVGDLYREAKRERASHWRESGGDKRRILPPAYEAKLAALDERKRAVSEAAKPMRAAFSALLEPARAAFKARVTERAAGAGPRTRSLVNAKALASMLDESDWHPAWKAIARSDSEAHDKLLAARAACRLYAGTYLDVEAAFARAKQDSAPRPPRFRPFQPVGKIQMQARDITWSSIGSLGRLEVETLAPRTAAPSARSNIRRITFDQSRDGETMRVSAICRLHRLPPDDAEVKWVALMIRRRGAELQLTMEHERFADPKRPAGQEAPAHVRLGWARDELGLRVARVMRGVHVLDEVHCPAAIVSQREHAERIESVADNLRVRALRLLRLVLARGGNRVHRPSFESDRQREWLRARCIDYARFVFGDALGDRWRAWRVDRIARGEDLYAPLRVLRRTMAAREAFAWWCLLWAKKDAHLERYASDALRRFQQRRDAHYRAEAIRIATRYASVTVDSYSVARLKELEPLTLPGTGVRDMAQWQLHSAAPGRFRELLIDVMGPRCTPSERSGGDEKAASARAQKAVRKRPDADQALADDARGT